jgi:hypothetical protein
MAGCAAIFRLRISITNFTTTTSPSTEDTR